MLPTFSGLSWIAPYGLMLVLGSVSVWWWSRRRAVRHALDPSHLDLLIPLALLIGVAGARFLTGILPGDVLHVGVGARAPFRLQLFGLFGAALLVVLLYARWAKLPCRVLLDVLALPALLWVVFLRAGCFLAGCCWGDLIHPPQELATLPPDFANQVHTLAWLDDAFRAVQVSFPSPGPAWQQHQAAGLLFPGAPASLAVHPSQLYEGGTVLALLVGLSRMERRERAPGAVALTALGGYLILRFMIEFVRADNPLILASFTMNQLICLGLLVPWAAALWVFRNRSRPGFLR